MAHAERVRLLAESNHAAATSPLAASWSRSMRHFGLEPENKAPAARLSLVEIQQRRDALGELLSVSQPVMDRLFSTLGTTGCSILMTDADGVVLDHRTTDADDTLFSQAGLADGAIWSEAMEGTNGIGTAIAEQRSVVIFRDEHFHDRNTEMSCMGAPVFDERGRLAAVLDVSSCRNDLTRPFARLISQSVIDAARQIESDHFQLAFSSSRIIRHPQDGQRGAMLFAVDRDDLVIGATRMARQAYGLNDESFRTPRPAGDLIGDTQERGIGLESAERRELRRALARSDGNMSAAARALGISRATLYRRMERLGLSE